MRLPFDCGSDGYVLALTRQCRHTVRGPCSDRRLPVTEM